MVRNLKIYTKPGRQTASEPLAEVPSAGIRIEAYPNPLTTKSRFIVESDRAGQARVTLHDVLGRSIRTMGSIQIAPGSNELRLRAHDLPPGLYLLRTEIDNVFTTSRLIVGR